MWGNFIFTHMIYMPYTKHQNFFKVKEKDIIVFLRSKILKFLARKKIFREQNFSKKICRKNFQPYQMMGED